MIWWLLLAGVGLYWVVFHRYIPPLTAEVINLAVMQHVRPWQPVDRIFESSPLADIVRSKEAASWCAQDIPNA